MVTPRPRKARRKPRNATFKIKKQEVNYRRFGNVFKKSVLQVMANEVDEVSQAYVDQLKALILGQKYSWRPLTPRYAEYKRRAKLDPRILIATGEYVNSIAIQRRTRDRGKLRVYVGVPYNRKHSSGLPFKVLARVHEFGSRKAHVPARPHWRPAKAWLMKEIPRIRERIARQAKKDLKKRS